MRGSGIDSNSEDLCRRCADGDEDAFREVYRQFGGTLYGTAWRILKNPQDAEEVVQEAFLTLYRKAAETPPTNLGAWLHRVTANRALDRIRKRTRQAEVELGDDIRPSRSTPTVGLDIERAIERLPERARMVFLLHDVEGFKHREIGALMGTSDGSSKSQLSRARSMLRDWLQPEDET